MSSSERLSTLFLLYYAPQISSLLVDLLFLKLYMVRAKLVVDSSCSNVLFFFLIRSIRDKDFNRRRDDRGREDRGREDRGRDRSPRRNEQREKGYDRRESDRRRDDDEKDNRRDRRDRNDRDERRREENHAPPRD